MTTILVVEDNPAHLRLAVAILSRAGYGVLQAGDAASAMRQAHEYQPALILTDINLPDRSGLDLVRELKKRPDHARDFGARGQRLPGRPPAPPRACRRLRRLHRQALSLRRIARHGGECAGQKLMACGPAFMKITGPCSGLSIRDFRRKRRVEHLPHAFSFAGLVDVGEQFLVRHKFVAVGADHPQTGTISTQAGAA